MHEKKKKLGQKLRNWKFSSFDQSSIDRIPIESDRFKPKNLSQFRSVNKHLQSIENLENTIFWKTEKFSAKTPQSIEFYE